MHTREPTTQTSMFSRMKRIFGRRGGVDMQMV
jgi:hypothetical protein